MGLKAILAIFILLSATLSAEFSITPYLYQNEKTATVDAISFQTASGAEAKLYKINGEESLLVIDDRLESDKAAVSSAISQYYMASFYPSVADLAELKGFAEAFNKSRNYMTKYGPAEKVCYESGTFLAHKPCDSYNSCVQTASLVCTITGADGCLIDLLATHILDFKQGVDKLNGAYTKFYSGFNNLGAAKITGSLALMDGAFDEMKAGADAVSKNKLRFPETTSCMDCIGVCPEAKFDYGAITAGKAKVAALKAKTAPFATMEQTAERIYLSTTERAKYRLGEEKAAVFAPKYELVKSKFGGLKAEAVEAKSLVTDSNFITVADSFISKSDELEQKLEKREFEGFDALLSGYESSARALAAVINNSTASYRKAMDAQDASVDQLIQAQWSVNRLSKESISGYNSLVEREKKLDEKIKPPLSSSQYEALATDYGKLTADAKTYVAASASLESPLFGAGNALSRTSVDGAMAIASSMTPISFKTRQSFAKYVPPLVLAAVDMAILAIGLLFFVGAFYYFHGFFRSRLAISGWVLSLLGFMFLLLIGSVGFYSIVLSTEKFSTFSDFVGTVKSSDRVAVIVEQGSGDSASLEAMKICADQIEKQLALSGKKTLKYYISGSQCSSITPKMGANNTTAYETKTGLLASSCLDSLPDIPVFDLQHSASSQAPAFTTVVTKQAIFKGPEDYYSKKPLCDAANVLE